MTRTRAPSENLGIDIATETGIETETVVSSAEVTRVDLVAAVESGEAGEGAEGGINIAPASHQVDNTHTVLIEAFAGCISSKQKLCHLIPRTRYIGAQTTSEDQLLTNASHRRCPGYGRRLYVLLEKELVTFCSCFVIISRG